MKKRKYRIYILIDPISDEVRYVGFTSVSINARFYDHMRIRVGRHGMSYKSRWIAKLVKLGHEPKIKQVFVYDNEADAKNKEISLIWFCRKIGVRLTNTTDGGDGILGYKRSPELIKMIAEKKRGVKHSDAAKAKMSASRRGVKLSEEHKRKISAAHKGEKSHFYGKRGVLSPAYGKKWNEKQREAIKKRVVVWTDERRAAQSEFMKKNNPFAGKKHTKETIEKLKSIPRRSGWTYVMSDETKKKISARAKERILNNPIYLELLRKNSADIAQRKISKRKNDN